MEINRKIATDRPTTVIGEVFAAIQEHPELCAVDFGSYDWQWLVTDLDNIDACQTKILELDRMADEEETAGHLASALAYRELELIVVRALNHKSEREVAVLFAEEVLGRYLNPLYACLYVEEFSNRLVNFHRSAPNGILRHHDSIEDQASEALTWDRFQDTTKAFLFDKLFGGEAA